MTQPQLLQGKVCAITGASTGIGRAITLEYLRHGAKVMVNHLDESIGEERKESWDSLAEETAKLGLRDNIDHVVGDITKPEIATLLVTETVSKFGRLDVFVSNAGVCKFADFLTLEHDLLTSTMNINLIGAFTAVQAAARQMVSQTPQGGSIIGMSSISALVGGGQKTHYCPTKAGVLSLMQSCAIALGKYNIRCNALLPGTIRTQLNEEQLSDPQKKQFQDSRTCLGRTGLPKDLGGPAVFLACDELSGYVTGSQLLVDGGLFVNLQ